MATYEISTKYKKSIVNVQFYEKDGHTLRNEIGWRWGSGTITIPDDEDPPWGDDPDGNDELNVYDYDFELDSLDDGCWDDVEWPDDLDDEELERLQELYSDDGISGLEDDGWECGEAELWFQGPLEVKKIDK